MQSETGTCQTVFPHLAMLSKGVPGLESGLIQIWTERCPNEGVWKQIWYSFGNVYLGSTITRSKPNQPGSLSHIYVCAKWTQGMPNGPKASCQVAYQTVAHLASGGQSWQPFAKYPESGAAYWTVGHLSSGLALSRTLDK